LPLDSVVLKFSFVDSQKNQTGFLFQTISKRDFGEMRIVPIKPLPGSSLKVDFHNISSILFQVVSQSKDPFWGSITFDQIMILP